jgi:hypothetical protein
MPYEIHKKKMRDRYEVHARYRLFTDCGEPLEDHETGRKCGSCSMKRKLRSAGIYEEVA